MSEGKTNVVIAEDDTVVSKNLSIELKEKGYEVLGAPESAEELLAQLSKNLPDIIIMDINLAGIIDGIEVASLIRPKFDIPIIYLTSDRDIETLDRAKTTNPDGYLIKPFDIDELVSTMEIAIHRKQIAKDKTNEVVVNEGHFFIKVKNRLEKVVFEDIHYVEANDIYSMLYTDKKNFVLSYSLKTLEEKLKSPDLLRVHRSYIVNIRHIQAIEDNYIQILKKDIPIGKTYREQLMSQLDVL